MRHETAPISQVTLAILAGGEGSRMGMAKGELRVDGQPILRYLARRFAWPGPLLLVTAPGRERPPGWESFTSEVADPVAGLGPLRGVLTALEFADTPHVIVTPVDMPGLTGGQLHWLASAFRAQGARRAGTLGLMTSRGANALEDPRARVQQDAPGRRVEPFPAVFDRDAAATIRGRLAAGKGSMHALAADPAFVVVPAPVDWDESTWVNLNRPADLTAFLENSPTL